MKRDGGYRNCNETLILMQKRVLCHFEEREIYSSEFTVDDSPLYTNN
jgi:hypothetical protein